MRFSLINFIYAFLIIMLTYIIVYFWRNLLRNKLLDHSDLEPGLKDSVTTISVYLVWTLGILVALHAFGLSPTSMAVAFGALGIGLGFGLQNIFNNFISGIILLFERPIQVGDAIEINGMWGEVRKINVRSTLVQTYDNASLIIPNAEFISSQVTNWSFKDMRLRRTVVVGVAYGSDVNLVKKTLEEIASKIQNVLKFPVPQVIFADFGDSALIFRLRVWTDIDHMLTVESDIRFEIYRLFEERGIEIAYPQLDIHVRTMEDKVTFVDPPAMTNIENKLK
jgi:potassium-dependent mechanosensitive channel